MKDEILRLRAEGKNYNQIRAILKCSKGTISYHCGNGQKEKWRERQRKNRKIKKSKIRKCENCNKNHYGSYASGRFCSHFCVRSYAGKRADRGKLSIIAINNNAIKPMQEANAIRNKNKREKREIERLNKVHICEKCNKQHDGLYASGRFCSDKCARSFSSNTNRVETNKKVSQTLTGRKKSRKLKLKIKNAELEYWKNYKKEHGKRIFKNRDNTNSKKRNRELSGTINPDKKCKYCKKKGSVLFYGSVCDECRITIYFLYREACRFKFNVRKYPEYFDLSLIENYGWYKAKNRGDNLNGISKDHLYSVSDGFRNKIDPKIISHPANCILMRHTDNQKKNTKSSITLKELKERIRKWANG